MSEQQNPYCQCLFYSANALSRVMNRMAERAFAPTGLAPSYAFLLMTVNNHPSIQPSLISEIMMLAPSTVTRLIEKMEKQGFLTREKEGKAIYVYPTAKAEEMQLLIKQCWKKLHETYVAILGEEESKKLTGLAYEATIKMQD